MTEESRIQPDCAPGAPHPRETARVFGQQAAEAAFLAAFNSGRLHHGWLLAGPRGVGKATLAWRIARFLLSTPAQAGDGLFGEDAAPETLDVPEEHPVSRRLLAMSEPGLFHIVRQVNEKTGRLRAQILADDVRRLNEFLGLSAADGGRRVVLVDSADEMNVQAANALLKMLEEPPERTVFLLVSHQPMRLLPTIRSRCLKLALSPLGPEDMSGALAQAGVEAGAGATAISELSGGSVGEAVRLADGGGPERYASIVSLASGFPKLRRPLALQIAEGAAARGGEENLDLVAGLLDMLLARLARTGATGAPPPEAAKGESEILARLSPDSGAARRWAECAAQTRRRMRLGREGNLDPVGLAFDTIVRISACAGAMSR